MWSTLASAFVLVSGTLIGTSACGSEVADDDAGSPVSSAGVAASSPTPARSGLAEPSDRATPGQPMEILYPEGTELAVVGVAHDDVLSVHHGPSTDFEVVTTLDPTGVGAIATGRGWRSPESAWVEVTTEQGAGWSDLGALAPRAGTHDLTNQVIRTLGERPTAPDMRDLGRIVAEALDSTDPASSIVMSVAPTSGDLGEVTFDVVGLGDDSVWAQRLHVFGQPDGAAFSLGSVEATYFCARGNPTGDLCP